MKTHALIALLVPLTLGACSVQEQPEPQADDGTPRETVIIREQTRTVAPAPTPAPSEEKGTVAEEIGEVFDAAGREAGDRVEDAWERAGDEVEEAAEGG